MSILRRVDVLHFEHTAADVEIALWIWNFNSCFAQMFLDQEIQIALEPAGPVTHFLAPDNELEVDCAVAEFLEENARLRFRKGCRMCARDGNQGLGRCVVGVAVNSAYA